MTQALFVPYTQLSWSSHIAQPGALALRFTAQRLNARTIVRCTNHLVALQTPRSNRCSAQGRSPLDSIRVLLL